MQARTFTTNRPHAGITHPARSKLTTTWPLQPGPLATSLGEYCNQPSFVSGGEAEDCGMWVMANSVHPLEASRASSVSPFNTRKISSGAILFYHHIYCQYSKGQAPARPPSCRPAVDLQRATPPCAGNRRQPSHLAYLLRPYRRNLPFQAFKPCSVTVVESRSVSVLALCMSSSSLHI